MALTMMERWEKILFRASAISYPIKPHILTAMNEYAVSLCAIMMTLLAVAVVSYLPHHISFLRQRASFYLSGQDVSSSFTAATTKGEADAWMTTRGEL